MDKLKALARKAWVKYRSWPMWGQILGGLVVVSVIVGPFMDASKKKDANATPSATTAPTTVASTTPTTSTTGPESASTTTSAASTTTPPSSFSGENPSSVYARDFDPWPLTVEDGLLACEGTDTAAIRVTFTTEGGTIYAVNGSARSVMEPNGWHDVNEIWKDNPTIPGTKINIGPLVDLGLSLR